MLVDGNDYAIPTKELVFFVVDLLVMVCMYLYPVPGV